MSDLPNVGEWRGHDVYLKDGEKLGRLEDVYYDAETDLPRFLCVRVGTLIHKQVLVPAADVTPSPDKLTVAWSQEDTGNAPTTKPGEELSAGDEERVFRHYGMDYVAPDTASGRRLVRR
ncbi:MAG: PRC-barrel domain-containing protein [Streptosporangiales bacterium]|nr:PRC-barrel domain-containing protein [Streptosporangiales bacterium]MBO0889573.1 PRC-barrel domain-containing protein [Acidothermales bacterium]